MLLRYAAPLIDRIILDGCIAEEIGVQLSLQSGTVCGPSPLGGCDDQAYADCHRGSVCRVPSHDDLRVRLTDNLRPSRVTAAFADNTETDVFSGSFTFDPSTYDLSAAVIT